MPKGIHAGAGYDEMKGMSFGELQVHVQDLEARR